MKVLIEGFKGLWTMYRPRYQPGYLKNWLVFFGLLFLVPSIFLWPVFFALKMLALRPTWARVAVLGLAVMNLLMTPLACLYFLVLALFSCRPYFTTPAAHALRQLEGVMREPNG